MNSNNSTKPKWQSALIVLTGLVVAVALVTGLQWGSPVLIPIAIAGLLTLLLSPVVQRLNGCGVHHVISVLLTVATAGLLMLALSWIMTIQVTRMLAELPKNTETIKSKIRSLRQVGSAPAAKQFGEMITEIGAELKPQTTHQNPATDDSAGLNNSQPQSPSAAHDHAHRETNATLWGWVTEHLGSAAEGIGAFAFGGVLQMFFLLEQREIRDRLVLLAGRARLSVTSNALDEISDRITRYLGMVAIVNGGFALLLSGMLYLCGMPYAMLWGFVAGALRFIPYIGPWVGALFPITMSVALSHGWWQPVAVLGCVIVLELVTNNAIEPLLFGRTTGVSPTALLISAAFWLYLWGPLGLVLSIPFAVCLVVIGKTIPELHFLAVMLSDEPALTADASFYQRLMLRDPEAAIAIAATHVQQPASRNVYDELLIPTLNRAKRDLHRRRLSNEDYQSIVESMRESLPKIHELIPRAKSPAVSQNSGAGNSPGTIIGCSTGEGADGVALEMLRSTLSDTPGPMRIVSAHKTDSAFVAGIVQDRPALICIASIPPGGLVTARGLCKRLRAALPDVPIVIGRWGQQRQNQNEREQLMLAGASAVTTTQAETCNVLYATLAPTTAD
ncbi:MAG: family transporter [Planctomycetaceae bacterium]|nr:family transporter [Planctomycetaceae bacterium]